MSGSIASWQQDVAMAPSVPRLQVDLIRRDGGTQMRVDLNQEVVAAYAERLEAGDSFPVVVVYYDGSAHWLADGFHRVAAVCLVASRVAGTPAEAFWRSITADVRAGTREDAIRAAIAANKTNGLRRTNADKQLAVRAALAHSAMRDLSDQTIADEAGVDRETIRRARAAQVAKSATSTQPRESPKESAPITKRTGIDGKSYPVKREAPAKPGRPAKSPEERREAERMRMAIKQAAKTGRPIAKRKCPMCNGRGHLND